MEIYIQNFIIKTDNQNKKHCFNLFQSNEILHKSGVYAGRV